MGFLSGLLGGGGKMNTGYSEEMIAKSLKEQTRQYDQSRADVMPWLDTGKQGLSKLSMLLGIGDNTGNSADYGSLNTPFSQDQFQESPNYQFNLGQGEQAINRANAAGGRYSSPSTIQELLKYSQGLASNEFSNAFNMDAQNKDRTYNMLAGISGSGQNAAGQTAAIGQNYANSVTDLNSQSSQINLAAQADKAARRQSAFSNILGAASTAATLFSDSRLKDNIVLVGKEKGHNIYEFNYKDGSGRYRGVLAHEVKKIEPDAVKEMSNGYLAVDYDKIGLKMERV